MRRTLALLALVLVSLASAQPRGPQLLAGEEGQPEKDRKPLGLASADIRVVLAGPIAETTLTLTFRNDSPRVLEGELMFPLPEGATISGFGLGVNGTLVDGVPVEKQKARVAFETETRKRIDPGLVEQAVGNNFRTRVYPIPAKGKRTIKVQYVSDIVETKDAGATYRLPLGWEQAVDDVKIVVEAAGTIAPATAAASVELPAFQKSAGKFVAEQVLKNAKLDRDLVLSLAKMDRQVLVEHHIKGATVQEMIEKKAPGDRSEWYFAISDVPPAEGGQAAAPVPDPRLDKRPLRVGILWDTSLSRLSADKARELVVLRKVIAALDPNAMVDLVAFRNEPDLVVSFPAQQIDKLIDTIGKLTYDGGTNLSLLPVVRNVAYLPGAPAADQPAPDFAYWLLFTDGIADLGPEMPAKLEKPCYVISNDARSNHPLLRRIAAQSGGRYLNLQRTGDDEAAGAIGHEPFVLMGVDAKDDQIADIYPRGAIPATGRITISGRLLVPEATVSLKYGRGGVVTHRAQVTLKQAGATETALVPRFWAQQKVADLSSDVDANAEALLAVGKEFNLVTPNTSLLVLETVEQYLQHRIVPPRSYKAVYDEFMKRIEHEQQRMAQTKEERIQQVLAMWKQRVEWWDRKVEIVDGRPFEVRVPPATLVQPAKQLTRSFENAPAGTILDYLSDAAGYTILTEPGTVLEGRVNIILKDPKDGIMPEEMIELLNTVGLKNDFSVVPAGERTVRVSNRNRGLSGPVDVAAATRPAGDIVNTGFTVGRIAARGGGSGPAAGQPVATPAPRGEAAAHPANQRMAASDSRGPASQDEARARVVDAVQEAQQEAQRATGRAELSVRQDLTPLFSEGAVVVEKALKRDSSFSFAPSITIKQWDPDVPYLKALREAGKEGEAAYAIYLKQRPQFVASPAFYLDCADYLLHIGETRLGVRVLTNVAELKLENAQLLRIVAHRLNQIGQRELAIDLFEKIQKMRPEEPQSWRDLALALSDRADAAGFGASPDGTAPAALKDYLRALDLLNHVVMNHWDRFEEIEVTALMEANRIIVALDRLPRSKEIAIPLDSRLVKNLDCDVRIVLTWDADLTDVDLWVTEPSGEKCYYQHNRTAIGGMLSRDFTQGYGPEEYCLRKLMPGEYKIQCNYYGSGQTSLVGPTTVQATVITHFGRPDEKRQSLTVRLAQQKDVVDIGAAQMK